MDDKLIEGGRELTLT